MAIPVSWPVIGGTPYSVPVTGETNWGSLTNYLVALSTAQGTQAQKFGARVATSSPVTVTSATDCAVVVNLTVPGPAVVQLPPGVNGQFFSISDGKGDAGTNNITVLPAVGQTINNGPSFIINSNNDAIGLIFTASNNNWKVTSQILSFSPGSVARNAIQAGTPDYVVINAPVTGLLAEEQFLNQVRGGFGTNVSSFNGVVKAALGSFSASPIVNADIDPAANIDVSKIAPGTVTSAQFARVAQMGRYAATTKITGGVGSINGGNPALFDLSAGTGQIIDYVSNPLNPLYTDVTWGSFTAQTLTNLATADITYLLISSAGAIIQQTSFPTPDQQRQNIFVTRINHSSRVTIQFVDNIGGNSVSAPNQLMDLFDALGPFNVTGNVLSPNGANLNINKSLGSMFSRYFNQVSTPLNPHIIPTPGLTAASFVYQLRTGSGGAPTIAVDPANFDNAGVLSGVGGGITTSTIQRVFLFPSNNIRIQYGQQTYPTLAEAVAAVTTEAFVINPTNVGFPILMGFIVLQRNTSALNSATARFLPAARFSGGSAGAAGGTTTLQNAYNNSVSPILTLSAAVGAFNIRDALVPLVGSLLNVQNNAAGVSYIDVSTQGVKSNQYPTAGRVMVTDSNSAASQSAVTSTELGFLSGTTGVTGTGKIVRDTNPTIAGPIIEGGTVIAGPTSPRITVPKNTYANLLLATRVEGTILYATDLDLFFADDGIALSPIGSGGSLNTNMIANPNNATGWTRTGTLFNVPITTTTAGDLPLGGIVSSAIQLVSTASSLESLNTNFVSYAVTTPSTFGGKLQVNMFLRPGTGFVSGEWTIGVYQGSTRQSLSSDSGGLTFIPNVNGPFTFSMDATASTAYTLRIFRNTGSGSATLNIANVFFGFPNIVQGAAISEWQTYTPAITGVGTAAGVSGFYRRVGSGIEVKGTFTTGTVTGAVASISIPPGLNLDFASLGSTADIGYLTKGVTGANKISTILAISANGSLLVFLGGLSGDGTTNGLTAQNGNNIFGNTELESFFFTAPISQWSGNGTVALGPGAQVEYAFNTSAITAAGASDATSFGYGPNGTLINAIASTTAAISSTNFTVQFQYPIQNDDIITLEFNSGTGWFNSDAVAPFIVINTSAYGARVAPSASTTATVIFGNQGWTTENALTYAASGRAWSVLSGASYRWRVRKAKASSPVGFGLAGTDGSAGLYKPGQAPGLVSGATIAAGYVGETIETTLGPAAAGASNTAYNIGSVIVGPGAWKIEGFYLFTAGTITSNTYALADLSTTSATLRGKQSEASTAAGTVPPSGPIYPLILNVAIGATQTVYLIGMYNFAAVGTSTLRGNILQTRIA